MVTPKKLWLVLLTLKVFNTSCFVVPSYKKLLTVPSFAGGSHVATRLGIKNFPPDDVDDIEERSLSRRQLLLSSLSFLLVGQYALPAAASLVQFPCKSGLMNSYHFMRAGTSLLEEQDIWSTNPLFLTNREAALSDVGENQVHAVCRYLEEHNVMPSAVRYSLAANCMDTADILSMDLQLGRNRVVPEYTFLDQRGIGRWEGLPLQSTQDAVWAMDSKEAGREGTGGRPPPHEDGTPNETLGNQVTRLRQLLSVLETSLSGDDVLLVFPDGTGPALLSCLIAGIPLSRVHELDYKPGEVRLGITYDSVRAMMPATPSLEYMQAVERGKVQLASLRAQDPQEIRNVKEQRHEAEMLAMREQEEALARAKAIEREEKQKALQLKKQQQEAARREELKLQEAKRQRKREEAQAARKQQQGGTSHIVSMGALGLASVATLMMGTNSDEETVASSISTASLNQTRVDVTGVEVMKGNATIEATTPTPADETVVQEETVAGPQQDLATSNPELRALEELVEEAPFDIPEFESNKRPTEAERIEAAEKAMQDYLDQDDGAEAWLGVMSDIFSDESG